MMDQSYYTIQQQVIANGAGNGTIRLNPIPYGQAVLMDYLTLLIPGSANVGTATIYTGIRLDPNDFDAIWSSSKPWEDRIEGWGQMILGGESLKVVFNGIGANMQAHIRGRGRILNMRNPV